MPHDADLVPPCDLTAIDARAAAATGGPWASGKNGGVRLVVSGLARPQMRLDIGTAGFENADADADFIAHARDDVPAMSAEIAQLRARVQALQSTRSTPGVIAALRLVRDVYNHGRNPRAMRDGMDGVIDYVRGALDSVAPLYEACIADGCGDADLSDINQKTGLCRMCEREK